MAGISNTDDCVAAAHPIAAPRLPNELVVRIAQYLRDRKLESLNNCRPDPEPNDIMRAMQRVCRSWYTIVTPMLYEDGIFGRCYLAPPIRRLYHILAETPDAHVLSRRADNGSHPIEWSQLDRIAWSVAQIRRLRYSRHYRGLEYQTDGSVPVAPWYGTLGEEMISSNPFRALQGVALDFTRQYPFSHDNNKPIYAMINLLVGYGYGTLQVCSADGRADLDAVQGLSEILLFDQVTAHVESSDHRHQSLPRFVACNSLTIDFQDPKGALFRSASKRLDTIVGAAYLLTEAHRYSYMRERDLVICRLEDDEDAQADFGETMDAIKEAMSDGDHLNLKWRYLDQTPGPDGKLRCKSCARVMGREALGLPPLTEREQLLERNNGVWEQYPTV